MKFIFVPGFMPATFFDIGWLPTIELNDDNDESGDMDDRDDSGELIVDGGIGEIGDIGILPRFMFCECIGGICCCADWLAGK